MLKCVSLTVFIGLILLSARGEPAESLQQDFSKNVSLRLYIGTYTTGNSRGIYRATLDQVTGKLSQPVVAVEARDPSFLALHPNGHFLYAVGAFTGTADQTIGRVSAYQIEPDGGLTLLNQEPSGGVGPCHLSVDSTGKCLLVANYGNGSVEALSLESNGRLSPSATVIQHQGSSLNPQRQAGPHAHFIEPTPDSQWALACDLGLDKILVYRFKPDQHLLLTNNPPAGQVAPGSGPRHFAFHPNHRWLYVDNEMGSSLTAFNFDSATGALKEFQTVSTLPPDCKVQNTAAEVQIHPNGRFLYVSNRGDDSLVVYRVDENSGRLTWQGRQSSEGKTPRHFTLSPGGSWLLAENQESENVTVFAVNQQDGSLRFTGQSIKTPKPVCLVFAPPR